MTNQITGMCAYCGHKGRAWITPRHLLCDDCYREHMEEELRIAKWDVSVLQAERDAAIESAVMPWRNALHGVLDIDITDVDRDEAVRRVNSYVRECMGEEPDAEPMNKTGSA